MIVSFGVSHPGVPILLYPFLGVSAKKARFSSAWKSTTVLVATAAEITSGTGDTSGCSVRLSFCV